jgi:hypothetical protein
VRERTAPNIKTPSGKAQWEKMITELETLDYPGTKENFLSQKVSPLAPGSTAETVEGTVLGPLGGTLYWVHTEAKRIAAAVLNAEIPGEPAAPAAVGTAAFWALVTAEVETLRPARDAKDAAAAADAALVEKEAQVRARGVVARVEAQLAHPHARAGRMMAAAKVTASHTPLKIGPLFEALVVARVAEIRAAAVAAAEEQKRRREQMKIEGEAIRRIAALKKQAEEQLREEQIRAKMAALLASEVSQDARLAARTAELSGLF